MQNNKHHKAHSADQAQNKYIDPSILHNNTPSLPIEIWRNIFKLLSFKEWSTLSRVQISFNDELQSNHYWQYYFQHDPRVVGLIKILSFKTQAQHDYYQGKDYRKSLRHIFSKPQIAFQPFFTILGYRSKISSTYIIKIQQDHPQHFALLMSDPNIAHHLISKIPSIFSLLSEQLRHNETFVNRHLKYGISLKHSSTAIRSNPITALTAIKNNGASLYQALTPSLKNSTDFAKSALSANPGTFKYMPAVIRRNPQLASMAIAKDGTLAGYVHKTLMMDEGFVKDVIKYNCVLLRYISPALCGNADIALAGLRSYAYQAGYISERLRGDYSFIKKVLDDSSTKKVSLFEYLSPQLRDSEDIAHQFIMKDPQSIRHLGPNLSNNPTFIFSAISHNSNAFIYTADRFKKDRNFIYKVARTLEHISKEFLIAIDKSLTSNHNFVYTLTREWQAMKNVDLAWSQSGHIFSEPTKSMLSFKSFVIEKRIDTCFVRQNGMTLATIRPHFRLCKEVVLHAVQQCGLALQFADNTLKDDAKIAAAALKNNPQSITHCSPRIQEAIRNRNSMGPQSHQIYQ